MTRQSTNVHKVNSKLKTGGLLTTTMPRNRKMMTSLSEAKVLIPVLTVVRLSGEMFTKAYLKFEFILVCKICTLGQKS